MKRAKYNLIIEELELISESKIEDYVSVLTLQKRRMLYKEISDIKSCIEILKKEMANMK